MGYTHDGAGLLVGDIFTDDEGVQCRIVGLGQKGGRNRYVVLTAEQRAQVDAIAAALDTTPTEFGR